MHVIFEDEKLLRTIEQIAEISGVSKSKIMEEAAAMFIKEPLVLKLLEKTDGFTPIQKRKIANIKSFSRVSTLINYLNADSESEDGELNRKYSDIISMRFGFGEYRPHTLEEIGNKYGVSRERIRQILSKLLAAPGVANKYDYFNERLDLSNLAGERVDSDSKILEIAEEEIKYITHSVISTVCSFFKIDQGEVFAKTRRAEVVAARQILMYMLHESLDLSASHIGRILDRDHTTVLHSLNKVTNLQETNAEYKNSIGLLSEKIFNTITGETDNIHIDSLSEIGVSETDTENVVQESSADTLKTRIEYLGLTDSVVKLLNKSSIRTIGGILSQKRSGLEKIQGFDLNKVKEIEQVLDGLGIELPK